MRSRNLIRNVQREEINAEPTSSVGDTHVKLFNDQPSWRRLFSVQRHSFSNFCDVHLITEEGYIPVHSVFLKGLSPFLDSLLPMANVPCKYDVISISLPDIPMPHLKSFLTLVYNGVVTLTAEATEEDIRNVMKLLHIGQMSLECAPCEMGCNMGKRNKTVRCYLNEVKIKDERYGNTKSAELQPVSTSTTSRTWSRVVSGPSSSSSRHCSSSSRQERPGGSFGGGVEMDLKQETNEEFEMKPDPLILKTRNNACVYLESLNEEKIQKYGELIKSGKELALDKLKLPKGMKYALNPKHNQVCANSQQNALKMVDTETIKTETERPQTRNQLHGKMASISTQIMEVTTQPQFGPGPSYSYSYFHQGQSKGLVKGVPKKLTASARARRSELSYYKQKKHWTNRRKIRNTKIPVVSMPQSKEPDRTKARRSLVKSHTSARRHMEIQDQEKQFPCKYCRKRFTHRCSLDVHVRVHTGVKPFKCDVCTRAFSQKGNLQQHVLIVHTGVKPFKCHVCFQTFSQKGNLKHHILRNHSGRIGG